MRRHLLLPVLALAVSVAACGDEGRLGGELSKRYGDAIVSVPDSISGTLLVEFPVSPFAERPDSARQTEARKVAEYVRDHYLRYKTVRKVTVEFMTRKEFETGKRGAASYTFTRGELDEPAP